MCHGTQQAVDDFLDLLTYECPITGRKRCAADPLRDIEHTQVTMDYNPMLIVSISLLYNLLFFVCAVYACMHVEWVPT